jgi:hypothetical protein
MKDYKFERDMSCESPCPTLDEIHLYKNEQDVDKRLELAYEYKISEDDLYPEDYNEILRCRYEAIQYILMDHKIIN